MKLTPANIARIEQVLSDYQDGHTIARIVIDNNLRDMNAFSGFLSVCRSLEIELRERKHSHPITPGELRDFQEWLREKKEAAQ